MKLKFYDDTDIVKRDEPFILGGKKHLYEFIRDVPGDNPDVLGDYDNNELAYRLDELGAFTSGTFPDSESCCFYIYFVNLPAARAFIKKLNAYISQKARLIREARAF